MDSFVKAPFLLDPFYLASVEGNYGFFRLKDLAPKGFRQSEYYNSWYRLSGLHDECGYIIDLGGGSFVNVSLGRTLNPANFRKAELDLLRDITPMVNTLVQKRWASAPGQQNKLRLQLQTALNSFGDSLLTEREKQVINMILRGHSTRSLSEKLSISMETVKLHRKHAYAKLEVSSQAELFYLFIDSLMSVENYEEGDALATYLNLRTGGQAT
jgi:DNA-binding CsgD family transcriptional regulator